MTQPFLTLARQGRSGWHHYLLGTLLTFGVPLVILTPAIMLIAQFLGLSDPPPNVVLYGDPFRALLLTAIGSAGMLLGLFLAVTRIHQRRFLSLVGVKAAVDWLRVLKAFVFWLSLCGVSFLITYLLIPSRFSFHSHSQEWLPFGLLAGVCVPLISLSRVLFVYGYLLQAIGLLIRKPLVLALVFGVAVGALSNQTYFGISFYWLVGIFAASFTSWIVLKDNGIELALGIDLAVSFSSLLLINNPRALFASPSLFKVNEVVALPESLVLVANVLMAVVFYWVVFHKPKVDFRPSTTPHL